MTTIAESLAHNLRSLARFSGRDTRAQFWPYALLLFAAFTLLGMAAMLPELIASFARAERFAAEHPELATLSSGPGHYSIRIEGHYPELMPDFSVFGTLIAVIAAASVALLAAAVTRRLHDSGRSGLWGLLPLPFLGIGLVAAERLFRTFGDDGPADLAPFFILFLNNIVYLACAGMLVVFLASASTRGDNRFGPPPAS